MAARIEGETDVTGDVSRAAETALALASEMERLSTKYAAADKQAARITALEKENAALKAEMANIKAFKETMKQFITD